MRLSARLNIIIGSTLAAFWIIAVIAGIIVQNYHTSELVKDQAVHTANSVMNGLNLLMLNGQMDKSDFLLRQSNKLDGIRDIYIIRSRFVNEVFGKPNTYKAPKDDIERTVLETGKIYSERLKTAEGAEIRIVVPYIAKSDRMGINCLSCHKVNDGQVIGALNMVMSVEKEENFTNRLKYILIVMAVAGVFTVIGVVYYTTKKTVQIPLARLVGVLDKISEGDLTMNLEPKGTGEIIQLYNSMNATIRSFRETLSELNHSSRELKDSSFSLSETADHILSNTKAQMNSVENSYQSLDNLSASSDNVGHHSELQAELSKSASLQMNTLSSSIEKISDHMMLIRKEQNQSADNIRASHESLHLVRENMKQINESAKGISDIMSAINDIADQTQLLSLNASIEAARVGDLGRGFAVVAQEIRKLAESSTLSAENARKLISKNSATINKGTDSMSGISFSLQNLFENIEQNTKRINVMAEEFSLQTKSLSESNSRIQKLDGLSQEIRDYARSQVEANNRIKDSIEIIRNHSADFLEIAKDLQERSERFKSESKELEEIIRKFKY